jgi:hypothetical protein
MIFLTAVFALLTAPVFAQVSPIDKGSMQLEGGIVFNSLSGDLYENSNDEGQTFFAVRPGAFYFVIPNLAVGAELDFSTWSQGDANTAEIGIGPKVLYAFDLDKSRTEVKGKIYPFVGAAFIYTSITQNSGASGAGDVKSSMTRMSLGAGALYMISSAVAVSASVVYDIDKWSPDEGSSLDGAVLQFGVGIASFIY